MKTATLIDFRKVMSDEDGKRLVQILGTVCKTDTYTTAYVASSTKHGPCERRVTLNNFDLQKAIDYFQRVINRETPATAHRNPKRRKYISALTKLIKGTANG